LATLALYLPHRIKTELSDYPVDAMSTSILKFLSA
jgi:hypothetical protein